MKYRGKDFAYAGDKTPEQKAFNRRRFFTGRMESYSKSLNAFYKAPEISRDYRFNDHLMSHCDNSALRAVASNPIVRREAFGLRKATLS